MTVYLCAFVAHRLLSEVGNTLKDVIAASHSGLSCAALVKAMVAFVVLQYIPWAGPRGV